MHERLNHHNFVPISECVAVLKLKCTRGEVWICGAYVLDTSYPDDEIAIVYNMLEELVRNAGKHAVGCIIAGDFNAQVGPVTEYDDPDIIGPYVAFARTPRGDLLVEWCSTHDFMIANTFVAGGAEGCWTYQKGDIKRQLDYVLVSTSLRKDFETCYIAAEIDIGSGHRPVATVLRFTARTARKKRKRKAWSVDVGAYRRELDSSLQSHTFANSNSDAQVDVLEGCMLPATEATRTDIPEDVDESTADAWDKIRQLLLGRRAVQIDLSLTSEARKAARKKLCKEIQKLTRREVKASKTHKISRILSEFRGLKKIAAIKGTEKPHTIKSVLDSEGAEVTDKQGLADVFASFYEKLYARQRGGAAAWPKSIPDRTKKKSHLRSCREH